LDCGVDAGLFSADPAIQAEGAKIAARHFSPADLSGFGNDPHAGVSETSGILAIQSMIAFSKALSGLNANSTRSSNAGWTNTRSDL
jgi:hypothetical protein